VERLRSDLDGWLAAQEADLPRPNLAYDPAAFARGVVDSLATLGKSTEWTPNGGCKSRLSSGKLELDCEETPFIVGPEMIAPGPLRVAVRFSTSETRGAPALWYRAADKPEFDGDRVALMASTEPGVREGRIDHQGTIRQLRIDFGRSKGGHAAVDWIRILDGDSDDQTLVNWSFDAAQAND
jgi:hypothetical protein